MKPSKYVPGTCFEGIRFIEVPAQTDGAVLKVFIKIYVKSTSQQLLVALSSIYFDQVYWLFRVCTRTSWYMRTGTLYAHVYCTYTPGISEVDRSMNQRQNIYDTRTYLFLSLVVSIVESLEPKDKYV